MLINEITIAEKKKRQKFADIPCPGCGDADCDHKQEHMTEGDLIRGDFPQHGEKEQLTTPAGHNYTWSEVERGYSLYGRFTYEGGEFTMYYDPQMGQFNNREPIEGDPKAQEVIDSLPNEYFANDEKESVISGIIDMILDGGTEEQLEEGQTTTDYVDTKEFGDYIKQYGGTDVDVVANKVLAALQVFQDKSREIFYKVEAEAGYNVNGKPVDKSLIRKIVPKRIPDDVVGTFIAKHLSLKKGSKLKPNWTWREDPKAFTQHPDMIKLRKFIQDKIQQALDSGNVPITIQHFDQDEEMAPQFRLNIQTNEGTRCWKGYKKKGMKTMFGKRVPNCVKEVDTGNPHKGKYVIKTDEPGRKSSDIVVMPDEKEAKQMVASLSKKKPNVNFWIELVEEIDIDLTKPPIRAELPDMSLPNAPAFNNQKLSTAVQKRYPAPDNIKDNVNSIVTQVIKNNNLKGPWKKAVMHDKKSGIGMAFISSDSTSDTIVINWHHNHITGVLVNKKPVRSGVIDKNIHTLAPDGPQPQKYNPIDKTKQEIDPVLKKRLDTPN